MRITLAAAFVLLFAFPALAGTITSVSPASIRSDSGEHNLTISGSELGDRVIFDGPTGRIEIEAQSASGDQVIVWIPAEVVSTAGNYTVVVTGAGGDSNPARFEVTPATNNGFVLLVPDPVVAEATSKEGAIVTFEVWPWGGSDPNPTYRCDPPSGSLFPFGPTEVQCVATNGAGERAFGSVSVFVYDPYGPVINVPDRIVVTADGPEGKVVTFEVTARDAIDGEATATCRPPSGSTFPIGTTLVECTATDSIGNGGYGAFEVEVKEKDGGGEEGDDHGTLVIHVPDDITVEATGAAGAEVRFEVTASGSDDPDPMITCDPASGSTFALGTTTVTCNATDIYGDRAVGELDVTVVDTTPPVMLLEDIDAEASGGSAVVTYEPEANDLVDGSVAVGCTPESGSTFPMGETTVRCSATDAHNNTADGTFVVRVGDRTPPHITSLTANPSTLAPANHKLVDVTVTAGVIDTNDPMPQCSITKVAANEAVDAPGSGSTEHDWMLTGALTLQLRAERSGGGDDREYTIFVTCSDAAGNSAMDAVKVTVPKGGDSSDKTIIAPPPPAPSGPTTKRRSVGKR